MNKEREFTELLRDSGATVLITLRVAVSGRGVEVLTDGAVSGCVDHLASWICSPATTNAAFAGVERIECDGTIDLLEFLEAHSGETPAGGRHWAPTTSRS